MVKQEDINKDVERYSFSKLSSFNSCKYGYKLTYIDHIKGIGNCFSSYGSEIHSLMERYAKGELDLWSLLDAYKWEFDVAIPEKFPDSPFVKDMRKLYYDQGVEFLKNFKGYPNYKILGVEQQFEIKIDDWLFNGVIDLIFEDENGKLIIQDYKSKSSFKNKKEQAEYARQLYLYSLYVKEKFNKYPDILRFYMFRKDTLIDIPFKIDGLDEALLWAKNTVDEIRFCWDYSPTCSEFFSQNLCNHRNHCKCKKY